jgi:hypothetical protein
VITAIGLVSLANLQVTRPPCEHDALDVPPNALVLLRSADFGTVRAWVTKVSGTLLPHRTDVVPAQLLPMLAPFGVVATDTIDGALQKVWQAWPHPGLWEHI